MGALGGRGEKEETEQSLCPPFFTKNTHSNKGRSTGSCLLSFAHVLAVFEGLSLRESRPAPWPQARSSHWLELFLSSLPVQRAYMEARLGKQV